MRMRLGERVRGFKGKSGRGIKGKSERGIEEEIG